MANKYAESFGVNIYSGTAGAAAASITTSMGEIKSLGNLGGFTGGGKIKVSRVNQSTRVNEYAPEMIDASPLDFVIGFDATNIDTLLALKMVKTAFKVLMPDAPVGGTATTIHGDGFMTECQIVGKEGDEVTAKIQIQPVAGWTFTKAAAGSGT